MLFAFDIGLDCFCIAALCVFKNTLAMIVGSDEFSNGPTTPSLVVDIVVVVMVSKFWREPWLAIQFLLIFFLWYNPFYARMYLFRDEDSSSEGSIFEEWWEKSFTHVRYEFITMILLQQNWTQYMWIHNFNRNISMLNIYIPLWGICFHDSLYQYSFFLSALWCWAMKKEKFFFNKKIKIIIKMQTVVWKLEIRSLYKEIGRLLNKSTIFILFICRILLSSTSWSYCSQKGTTAEMW